MRSSTAPWPPPHTLPIRWTVPAHPFALAVVRRGASAVGDVCGTESAEILCLVLTELLTNAIRHAGLETRDEVEVELEIDRSIRGSVTDPGAGFDVDPQGPRPDGEGGYGLYIVERLARRWGIDRTEEGTKVWFEL